MFNTTSNSNCNRPMNSCGICCCNNGGNGAGGGISVGLGLPSSVFAVSGSPVTSVGTLVGSFIPQPAGYVFAGPATGGPAIPSFRPLLPSDFAASFSLFTQDGVTVDFSGAGTEADPLTAEVILSSALNNSLLILGDGLFNANTIQAGVVYGGIVTWLSDYDYHVSAAGYYINGNFYTSPESFFTLSPPDLIDNRIDTFIVDVTGSTSVLEGVPSSNPAQAPIDPATQLELSIALVEVGTTEPTIATECIYRNNAEYLTLSSNLVRIDPDYTSVTCNGAKAVKGTTTVSGDNILFTRVSAFNPITSHSLITMLLKAEAGWSNVNNFITLRWENSSIPVGNPVVLKAGNFGISSSIPGSCQIVSIPLSAFALTPLSSVDSLRATVTVASGSLSFTLDDICLQGQPVPEQPTSVDEKFKISANDTTTGFWSDKILAGPGVTFTVNNPGANETVSISAGIGNTYNNALTESAGNVQWGGILLHDTVISTSPFHSTFNSSSTSHTVQSNNTGAAGTAIIGISSGVGGSGVTGNSVNDGYGGVFQTSGALRPGLVASGGKGAQITSFAATTNDENLTLKLSRSTPGTAQVGIGGTISLALDTNLGSSPDYAQMAWVATNVGDLTYGGELIFRTSNAGSLNDVFRLGTDGEAQLHAYGVGAFTSGVSTYMLTVDASGNLIESAFPVGGFVYTVDNGLTENVANNFQLGGTLLHNTTIATTPSFTLTVSGNVPSATGNGTLIAINNSALDGNAAAVYGSSSNNIGGRFTGGVYGVYGDSTTVAGGVGIRGNSSAGQGASSVGVLGFSVDGVALQGIVTNTFNSTVVPTFSLNRNFVGPGLDGIGQSMTFTVTTSTGIGQNTNEIVSRWTTANSATRVSEYSIKGVNNAVIATLLTLAGSGQLQLNKYGVGSFTGSAAYGLAVTAAGQLIEGPIGGGISSITADNGLTANTATNVRLGGSLVTTTTITSTGQTFTITGADPFGGGTGSLIVQNTAGGNALRVIADSGFGIRASTNSGGAAVQGYAANNAGVRGDTDDGFGVLGIATASGAGLSGSSDSGVGLLADSQSGYGMMVSTLTGAYGASIGKGNNGAASVQTALQVYGAQAFGVGAGVALDMSMNFNGGLVPGTRFISRATTTPLGSSQADFVLQMRTGNALYDAFSILGSTGEAKLHTYGSGAIGGVATFGLAVTGAGKIVEIALGTGMTNPMSAVGDLITSSDGAGTPARIAAGTAGFVLTSNGPGTQPTYQAAGGSSGITRSVNSVSSPTTMGATALTDYVYFVSGTTTVTLPTAVGNTNRYTVHNAGGNTVTIATTGGQTINGSSTQTLVTQYESADLMSNNSNWFII